MYLPPKEQRRIAVSTVAGFFLFFPINNRIQLFLSIAPLPIRFPYRFKGFILQPKGDDCGESKKKKRKPKSRKGKMKEEKLERRKGMGKVEKGREIREWTEKPGKRRGCSLPLE